MPSKSQGKTHKKTASRPSIAKHELSKKINELVKNNNQIVEASPREIYIPGKSLVI